MTATPRVFAALLALCATLPALPVLAQQGPRFEDGTFYAEVRGWTVTQGTMGCTAYHADSPSIYLNTPPAGGWQLAFPYPTQDTLDLPAVIDVDKYSFEDTLYGDGQYLYASFDLPLRKAVGEGNVLFVEAGSTQIRIDLHGTTAALLKVEECWMNMSGWTSASSRAGTFAFK